MNTEDSVRGIHRRTRFTVTESLRRRFAAKVSTDTPDKCWEWHGAARNGYGAIKHNRVVLSAHIVAFVVAGNEVPDGKIVCHTCDNRLCCNPAHLYCGTPTDNVRDMQARRRVRPPRGEEMYNAKLTDEIVRQIWALKVLYGHGRHRIAKRLNLPVHRVGCVLKRQAWRHVAVPSQQEAQQIVSSIR